MKIYLVFIFIISSVLLKAQYNSGWIILPTAAIDNYRIKTSSFEGILVNSFPTSLEYHFNAKISSGILLSPGFYHTSQISDADFTGSIHSIGISTTLHLYDQNLFGFHTRLIGAKTFHQMRKEITPTEVFEQFGEGLQFGINFGGSYRVTNEYGEIKPYTFFMELGIISIKHYLDEVTLNGNPLNIQHEMLENPTAVNFNISLGMKINLKQSLDTE